MSYLALTASLSVFVSAMWKLGPNIAPSSMVILLIASAISIVPLNVAPALITKLLVLVPDLIIPSNTEPFSKVMVEWSTLKVAWLPILAWEPKVKVLPCPCLSS